jgi:hypothetical protein
MHYVGRAFDMALPTGMQNLRTDPYIIAQSPYGRRKWEVWCKTDNRDVPIVELEGTHVTSARNAQGKRYTILKTKVVKCRAFNFSALAREYGFRGISGRRSFFRGGNYSGAEWWHFQWEEGLVEGETTFGEELLKVYPLSTAETFIYWDEAKDCIWRVNWF